MTTSKKIDFDKKIISEYEREKKILVLIRTRNLEAYLGIREKEKENFLSYK